MDGRRVCPRMCRLLDTLYRLAPLRNCLFPLSFMLTVSDRQNSRPQGTTRFYSIWFFSTVTNDFPFCPRRELPSQSDPAPTSLCSLDFPFRRKKRDDWVFHDFPFDNIVCKPDGDVLIWEHFGVIIIIIIIVISILLRNGEQMSMNLVSLPFVRRMQRTSALSRRTERSPGTTATKVDDNRTIHWNGHGYEHTRIVGEL